VVMDKRWAHFSPAITGSVAGIPSGHVGRPSGMPRDLADALCIW
jgi:hypothetical protein